MKKRTWNLRRGGGAGTDRAPADEEKGLARPAALALLLLLITVLMFQLIDDGDRRGRRRAREIRSQHARERMREERARQAATLPVRPPPAGAAYDEPASPPASP